MDALVHLEVPLHEQEPLRLLTINTGSSSLKAAVYEMGRPARVTLSATVERIGLHAGHVHIRDAAGVSLLDEPRDFPDHHSAILLLLQCLERYGYQESLKAIGHRVVHGGRRYGDPQPVTDELLTVLRTLIPIDPMHLPQAIDAIDAVRHALPAVHQVACFDTAFHRRMPHVAQMYALPDHFEDAGVMRYGFHGLSCESIMEQLHTGDPVAVAGRVVIAHLGNGASMTAVRGGIGIDTTMGFTPTGGLVMGTRSGDLDPGVVVYLLSSGLVRVDALSDLVNRQAGLLGVSGLSADMHDLLADEASNQRAAEAVDLFCYQAKKYLGGLVAVLGGLDTLIFTGGMGEHADAIRERICDGLDSMGIRVDGERNREHRPIISPDNNPVTVRVMATDEDLVIARHTARIVRE